MKLNFLNEKPKQILSGELCLRSRSSTVIGLDDEELEEIFGEFVESSQEEEVKSES